MKAEPLKDKEIRNVPKLTCYPENTGMFRKDDVASAVLWLRISMAKSSRYDLGESIISLHKCKELIDEAFEDVVKEK